MSTPRRNRNEGAGRKPDPSGGGDAAATPPPSENPPWSPFANYSRAAFLRDAHEGVAARSPTSLARMLKNAMALGVGEDAALTTLNRAWPGMPEVALRGAFADARNSTPTGEDGMFLDYVERAVADVISLAFEPLLKSETGPEVPTLPPPVPAGAVEAQGARQPQAPTAATEQVVLAELKKAAGRYVPERELKAALEKRRLTSSGIRSYVSRLRAKGWAIESAPRDSETEQGYRLKVDVAAPSRAAP